MKHKEYASGTFCKSIQCEKHKSLENLPREEYLLRKSSLCGDCFAWKLFTWLGEKEYRILKTEPRLSARELAARIRGIDPMFVNDLTEDEILCL